MRTYGAAQTPGKKESNNGPQVVGRDLFSAPQGWISTWTCDGVTDRINSMIIKGLGCHTWRHTSSHVPAWCDTRKVPGWIPHACNHVIVMSAFMHYAHLEGDRERGAAMGASDTNTIPFNPMALARSTQQRGSLGVAILGMPRSGPPRAPRDSFDQTDRDRNHGGHRGHLRPRDARLLRR